ncbi:hypothetical protein MesoLj131a_61570 [Mesorhizobium sp. 131-2-1]|nr:hypothetical protein MesoLj131a_61570 [Mesorhizobium sp. 131-2-1]BCH04364.1 hypothetical protein MesoLj131b_63630 [Mesorhizobium sp. 131-2-5]
MDRRLQIGQWKSAGVDIDDVFETGEARQTVHYVQVSQLDHANEKQFLTIDCTTADRTQADHGRTRLMAIAWSSVARFGSLDAAVAFG